MHLDYGSKSMHRQRPDECFASYYAAFNFVLMDFALTSNSSVQLKTELDALAKTDVRYSCISVSRLQWAPITKSSGNISWQHKDL